MSTAKNIATTLALWKSHWERSKQEWNPFVRLQEPIWCTTNAAAKAEGLTGSFAMIRLTDHRIVINIEQIVASKIQDYAVEILAHEIGHHIFTPANLYDNAVLLGRIRWGLPGIADRAPMVSNLYTDFLINDKLQRGNKLQMMQVYQTINTANTFTELWTLMMRAYEYLWRLKRGTLATKLSMHNAKIDADASLIAGIIRSYAKNWLEGGGRFALMLYPYLIDDKSYSSARKNILVLLDAEQAGKDADIMSGMTALDVEGINGIIDLRKQTVDGGTPTDTAGLGIDKNKIGGKGPQNKYLGPGQYIDLMLQANPKADEQRLVNAYYKEVALRHLIEFPKEIKENASETLPEGLDTWDIGDPMEELDWLATSILSPQIFPGINTKKRRYGSDVDSELGENPLNVYIGIDCSGSMTNPKQNFSWPVLAATIIGLSALRAGAEVMGCLSGEPGQYLETAGFISNETNLLTTITSYLGTGYAYGIERLRKPFENAPKTKSHVIIVTDNDIFSMLSAETETDQSHWELIEIALNNAGGHGTIVLHAQPDYKNDLVKRLRDMGWHLYYVTGEEELLKFAKDFSHQNYAYAKV